MDVTGLTGSAPIPGDDRTTFGRAEPFPVANVDEVLNVASVLAICNAKPDLLIVALQSMGNDLRASIRDAGENSRSVLRPHLNAIQETIKNRLTLRAELKKDGEERRDLVVRKTTLDEEIRYLYAEITLARYAEEDKRLREEEERLCQEHERAVGALADAIANDDQVRKTRWAELAPVRAARLERLHSRAERTREYVNDTARRATALGDSLITHRVARFLSWLGFASVAATGAIWTLFVRKDAEKELSSLLVLIRRFTQSLAPIAFFQYFYAVLVLFGSVTLAVIVFMVTDRLLSRRFEEKWESDQSEDDRHLAKIAPTAINRRSYVQLLAATPIVFALGLGAALFGAASDASEDPPKFLFALTQAFVGSGVALVATATFMMYAIKFLEPRLRRGNTDAPAPAWEFAVAPVALLIAVIVSLVAPAEDRWSWGGWTLFMMCSSLALGYGLVYRGIYNDASDARRNLQWLEREIESVQTPGERKTDNERAAAELVERYRKDRAELQSRRRQLLVGRFMKVKAGGKTTEARRNPFLADAKRYVLRILGSSVTSAAEAPDADQAGSSDTDALELQATRDRVLRLSDKRIERTQVEIQLRHLEDAIAEKEEVSKWKVLEDLRTQQAKIEGAIAASEAQDRSQQALTRKAETEFLERVRSVIAAAGFIRGPFDDFLNLALDTKPKPIPPSPTVHP